MNLRRGGDPPRHVTVERGMDSTQERVTTDFCAQGRPMTKSELCLPCAGPKPRSILTDMVGGAGLAAEDHASEGHAVEDIEDCAVNREDKEDNEKEEAEEPRERRMSFFVTKPETVDAWVSEVELGEDARAGLWQLTNFLFKRRSRRAH